jgi:hypothetical protein
MSKSKRRREEEARRAREAAERAVVASDPAAGDAAAPEAELHVVAQEALTVREAAIAAREASLSAREADADLGFTDRNAARLRELEQREAAMLDRARDLDQRQAAFDAKCLGVAAIAEARETEIQRREAEALVGVSKSRMDALAPIFARRDALVADIARLEEQLAADRVNAIKRSSVELDSQLQAARLAHLAALAALEAERESVRSSIDTLRKSMSEHRAKVVSELEDELYELRRARLAEADKLASKRLLEADAEVESIRARLRLAEAAAEERSLLAERARAKAEMESAIIEEDRQALQQRIAHRVEEEVRTALMDRESAEKRCETLKSRLEVYESERAAIDEIKRNLGGKSPAMVLNELDSARKRVSELESSLAAQPSGALIQEAEKTRLERDQLRRDIGVRAKEVAELQAQRHKWLLSVSQLEEQRGLAEAMNRRRETAEAQLKLLGDEVQRLEALYKRPSVREARVGVIHEPFVTSPTPATLRPKSELDWLGSIARGCEASGIVFPKRLLFAFHTALKTAEWSPLAVLAGVSGTGKSELPRLYSRFGGINFLAVPVQPNWDSPQSVFGFFNSVDNKFNATPLLRLLAQSSREAGNNKGLKDQLSLVLLDEMNLAHVELYFSDMLSKLEQRRGDSRLQNLEIDLGAGMDKELIPLVPNVLWCGTMNEDETTKSLSDKVVDRGNVLVFPRPEKLNRRPSPRLAPPSDPLPWAVWDSWLQKSSQLSEGSVDRYRSVLEDMNRHLEQVGRAIGHRVWQSVESYMANHPLVLNARSQGDSAELDRAEREAFEDQLVQKVMPKLRGIEARGEARRRCLDPIRGLIAEHGPSLSADFELALSSGFDTFAWRSAKYLSVGEA